MKVNDPILKRNFYSNLESESIMILTSNFFDISAYVFSFEGTQEIEKAYLPLYRLVQARETKIPDFKEA